MPYSRPNPCVPDKFTVMTDERIEGVLSGLKGRHPGQEEFMQAVEEVLVSLKPLFEKQRDEDYLGAFNGA